MIKFGFDGAKKTVLNDKGELVITTGLGDITQSKPVAYQVINGTRRAVDARYELSKKGKVTVELGEYDRTQLLTIDPTIEYATYIGGAGADIIKDVAVDSSGNVYITGYTTSTNFPTTSGAYRTTVIGNNDAFILKLNPTASGLVYSTYFGGSGQDWANSIAIDSSGNAYITGQTSSPTNLPLSTARQGT
jgi:hypothetical protein